MARNLKKGSNWFETKSLKRALEYVKFRYENYSKPSDAIYSIVMMESPILRVCPHRDAKKLEKQGYEILPINRELL